MATQIKTEYTLEQLTQHTVNVLKVDSATINGTLYELERTRLCFANSPVGREKISETLPKEYADAVFSIWGDAPTITDPIVPQEE